MTDRQKKCSPVVAASEELNSALPAYYVGQNDYRQNDSESQHEISFHNSFTQSGCTVEGSTVSTGDCFAAGGPSALEFPGSLAEPEPTREGAASQEPGNSDESCQYGITGSQNSLTPPILTGGVLHPRSEFLGVHLDYLTITLGKRSSQVMVKNTVLFESGYPQNGFKSSEKRVCLGGEAWRKFEPRQASKKFGLNYESWDFVGQVAQGNSLWMRCQEGFSDDVRARRVDVAFDFIVPDEYRPENFMDKCRDYFASKGISEGCAGQGGINTRYIGSVRSIRRIRIYRKDCQDTYYEKKYGAVLRIELILKDIQAEMFWKIWVDNSQKAYKYAASQVYDMTGFVVAECMENMPVMPITPPTKIINTIRALLDQYANFIDAALRSGLDLETAINEKVKTNNRMANSRNREYRNQFQTMDTEEINRIAISIATGKGLDEYSKPDNEFYKGENDY